MRVIFQKQYLIHSGLSVDEFNNTFPPSICSIRRNIPTLILDFIKYYEKDRPDTLENYVSYPHSCHLHETFLAVFASNNLSPS